MKKEDETPGIIAALLVLFTAMLDPVVAFVLAALGIVALVVRERRKPRPQS